MTEEQQRKGGFTMPKRRKGTKRPGKSAGGDTLRTTQAPSDRPDHARAGPTRPRTGTPPHAMVDIEMYETDDLRAAMSMLFRFHASLKKDVRKGKGKGKVDPRDVYLLGIAVDAMVCAVMCGEDRDARVVRRMKVIQRR